MGWFLLALILFASLPIVIVFGSIAADLLGTEEGE